MSKFKVGDKVVCIDAAASGKSLKYKRLYTVSGFNTLDNGENLIFLAEFPYERIGFFTYRFDLVEEAKQEPPKPPSFKNYLSPMCRVEMRNGDVAIFIEDSFIGDGSVVGCVSQYLDDGKVAPPNNVGLNKELEIVRVLEKPPYLASIFFEDHFGNVLWESHELATKRKEKDEKINFKQIEINMAQRKLDELVKQLKEMGDA